MKVFIASDHAGFALKKKVIDYLKEYHGSDYDLHDCGPDTDERVDYPDFADKLCYKLREDLKSSWGVLICGSGQGMAIQANKHPFVRAALCFTAEQAELSRGHNDANVLCLGSRMTDDLTAFQLIETFFKTSFEGGRHTHRVEKIGKPTD